MKAILALDLGTTGNRAIIYGENWEVLASDYQEFSQIFPQPGWVEHDPIEIWTTALQVLKNTLAKVPGLKISAMGITNQRETVVMWDKLTGTPVYNAIVWQCRRTTARCQALAPHAASIRTKTGLPIDPYFSASKLDWILTQVPQAQALLKKNQLLCGTIDTWILWQLTGQQVHATDASNAARTMLMNIETGQYDPELLALFGIPHEILPEIKPSDALFGYTQENSLGVSLPITAVLGDQQAALFAQCGEDPGTIKNTYGTGLFVVTPTPKRIHTPTLISTIAWQRNQQTYYALEGSIFTGGSVIQWIRDQCHWLQNAQEAESLAASVPDSGGVYFIPALTGLGAPHWTPEARGTIFGLTRGSSPAHITRAALEALAFQTADVIEAMQALQPLPFTQLYVDGGACKNNLLMQFQADLLNMPVQRPHNIESTAKGIAGFAAIAAGLCTEVSFRKSHTIEHAFIPHITQEQRRKFQQSWKKALTHAIQYAQA